MADHEGELRADLQRYYGIDLDHAMGGEHTPYHIAELVRFLPHDGSIGRAYDEDAAWSLDRTLVAMLVNSLNALIWGMGDKSKRGPQPDRVGPSYMRFKKRTLEAQAMPIEQLMEILSRERR